MFESAYWIGLSEKENRDCNGHFAYFRHRFELNETGECFINICANSRYRMWINGQSVLSGPCRSDQWYSYYDTVDISSYLQKGENIIALQVLVFDEKQVTDGSDDRAAIYSVVSNYPRHLLVIDGAVIGKDKTVLHTLTTGAAAWKAAPEDHVQLVKWNLKNEFMGAMSEMIDCSQTDLNWKAISYDDSNWALAENKIPASHQKNRQLVGLMDKFHLYPRPIPLLLEQPAMELKPLLVRKMQPDGSFKSEPLVSLQDPYQIEAGKKVQLLFTTDVLMNGYLQMHFAKGAGSKVTILCFEKFFKEDGHVKRDDYVNGEIYPNPQTDMLRLNGEDVTFEPFWYRTIRFLQVEIETGEEAVLLYPPNLKKMGYPLQPKFQFTAEIPWMKKLWDMCLRTLENCMTDAYMDCPFWEQMQYPMDTRLQALFTYACDGDTGLIKKALWDFHSSKIPNGLIQGKAPSAFPQVISTFSLHYIFMIKEYLDACGDVAGIRKYLGDVDDILN
jgi:hypothetical protein